ncbi:RelA/SpoT domain-containing protein [[Clostridium] sordellii]|uniref:RelA/SpoT domain-containing protein n=1 Tax=Paraclostridium sordellii TaxID=1505 RepID=UPI0005E4656F|nr:RelA/SpoT domain-containing protein [Paeniclostridium sordellii]CEN22066.1 RelA/SpoT domain-containing protein [[Clostridium] sordellii] [Paeniclostridium sordellii]CEN24175.1 RelA/SpoT domain-containing protein [[Clostridium] sordellii] [Paeniclostridium sordellii]
MLKKDEFLKKYKISDKELIEIGIDWNDLEEIYEDFMIYRKSYETQAELIATILRNHPKVHSVKTRVKNPDHLIEKIIRKVENRRKKYGKNFSFTVENYKNEITDLLGIRVIHIFKEDWEEIHSFITRMWNVLEIVSNVREGDNTKKFEELGIEVCSRLSGYRSVHYIIESYPTTQKMIAEIQVRTIFEEGYGEIDHQLRYSHKQIPEVLAQNLMLLNRIAGSSDEMASLINVLSKSMEDAKKEYEEKLREKDKEIEELLKLVNKKDKK